jgi:hypothetical protein
MNKVITKRKGKIAQLVNKIETDECTISEYNEFMNTKSIQIDDMKHNQTIRRLKIFNLRDQIHELYCYINEDNMNISHTRSSMYKRKCPGTKLYTRLSTNRKSKTWNDRMIQSEIKLEHMTYKSTDTTVQYETIILNNIQKMPDDIILYIYDYLDYNTRVIILNAKYKIYNTLSKLSSNQVRLTLCTAFNLNSCIICKSCTNGCRTCKQCIISSTSPCTYHKCDSCRNCQYCKILRSSDIGKTIWTKSVSNIITLFKSGDLTNAPLQHYNVMKRIPTIVDIYST